MKDIVGDYRERFRLQRKALRRYTALLLVLAMITTLFVNWQLHSDGIAATAQYQCNQEEHTHTADCYTKVLVCGYEEGQPEDWNATFDDSASLDESFGVDAEDDGIALFSAEPEYIYVPHEHTDDCYQEVKTLTCLEEEHVHGDDCFDPEDGSLICEQFEHVHDDSCYTTDYELVCGLEDGELVEELNPAYTAVAAFEAPVAAKPVVVSPVIEAPIHYHTDDCYEEVLTCGLEEHHHTVNCLADPLADVEDESEWLAKTNTTLSGLWTEDLLTVAQSQLGYEFEIRQPYTIPSDGKSVAAEIGRFDLPAAYIYQSTPKIDKDAFLVAEATGWERLNLLQGEANVYFENTFVGKSILDPGQTSDTLRFSMGRDRSIRIERTKENDYSSRRAIGSNQTQTVAWKFSVRNTRPEPVVLTLADQLPVSRNSAIAVSAEELSGGQLDKESGIVTWRLELKPGEQRELRLRYAVKYPKGRSLTIE